MVCKKCGTESTGKFCSFCGMPFYGEDKLGKSGMEKDTLKKTPEDMMRTPAKRDAAVSTEREMPASKRHEAPTPAASGARSERVKIPFRRVFAPIMALFLPLCYFFVDVFARLSPALFAKDELGELPLLQMISRLSSQEYSLNSIQEIKILTLGSGASLFETVSIANFAQSAGLRVPLCIVAVLCLLCALLGLILLCSAGRLLRSRVVLDFLALVGYGATFSPLIGLLYVRIWHFCNGGIQAADAAMGRLTLSVESVLLVALMLCILLPAVHTLRQAGAAARGEGAHVVLPFCPVGGNSFGLVRALCLLFLFTSVAIAALQLTLPIFVSGETLHLVAAIKNLAADSKALLSALKNVFIANSAEVDFAALTQALLKLLSFLQLPLLLLGLVALLPCVLRVLLGKKSSLFEKKRRRRSVLATGKRVRRLVLLPFWSCAVLQVLLVLLWLLGSKIVLRLEVGNVPQTLEFVYLIAAYVKSICATNTLYVATAGAGIVCAHMAGNAAKKLLRLSCASRPE